jgi:rubrerythrin
MPFFGVLWWAQHRNLGWKIAACMDVHILKIDNVGEEKDKNRSWTCQVCTGHVFMRKRENGCCYYCGVSYRAWAF